MASNQSQAGTIRMAAKRSLAVDVLEQNRCAVCGACVGSCPYFMFKEGRVVLKDRCTLDEGRCWDFCPMGGARGDFDGELGPVKGILVARAVKSEYRRRSQYGGVVSVLSALALKEKLVGEMIVTSGDPEAVPVGVRAKTKAKILESAGSRYAASAALTALNEALAEEDDSLLGLVGTPCQIKAANAMRRAKKADVRFQPKRIKLLIGLFCTWALDFRKLDKYLRFMLFGERPFGYDIPPPPANVFKVMTGDGIKAFPLEEIRPMRLNACRFCDDMTSAKADVSVGSTEGLDGWNTVIVRTTTGQRLVKAAIDKGLIKVDKLPVDDMEHLREAAGMKKERAAVTWHVEG